jgi:hypothetical protein
MLVKEAGGLEEPGSGLNAEADAKGLIFFDRCRPAVQEEDFGFSMDKRKKEKGKEGSWRWTALDVVRSS